MLPELLAIATGPYALPVLAGAVAVYILASYIVAYRRLRHFDGPWLASFSSLWMAIQVPKLRQGAIYHDIMKKYGSGLVRVGPNDLVTDSPDVIRRMASARSTYRRSTWYHAVKFDPYGDSVLSTMDTGAHDKLKAKLAGGYSGKEVPGLEGLVDEQLENLIALIRRKYISQDGAPGGLRPMDLGNTISYFTLDTITRLAYGKEFGFLQADKDVHGYLRIVEESLPAIVGSCEIPFLQAILLNPTFLKYFGPRPTDTEGMGKIMGLAKVVVGERFGPDAKDELDMLGSFVRHGVSQGQCEQEVLLQIPAGSDTSATALRGTIMLLSQSPLAYRRLLREIDEAVRAHGLHGRVVPLELAKTLPYLQAVIYEGIRMSPPFTGLLMKEVPPGGDTIEGRFVPAGTRIGVAAKALLMHRGVFGPDAEMFRPERFLECDDAQRLNLQQTVELVFGYGRWMCAGKPLAFMELNKVYFELFRRFDFQLLNTRNPAREVSGNIQFQRDLFVKITERKHDEE